MAPPPSNSSSTSSLPQSVSIQVSESPTTSSSPLYSSNYSGKSYSNANHKSHSTAIANDKSHSTAIANNKSHSTAITNDKSHSTAIANDKSHSTAIANNKSHSTAITNDRSHSTAIANDKSHSTAIANDKSHSTAIANDNSYSNSSVKSNSNSSDKSNSNSSDKSNSTSNDTSHSTSSEYTSSKSSKNASSAQETTTKKTKPKSRTRKKLISNNRTHSPYNSLHACCNAPPPPPPMIYRPDMGYHEKVKGPFKRPIPTPYQRQLDKYKERYCPPRDCNPTRLNPRQPKPNNNITHDDIREFKVCRAELQRLREERWKEQERKAILEDKRRQEWMEQQYQHQVQEWEKAQTKCQKDMERRKALLKQILCHRKELKKLKEEARLWRRHQQDLMLKQQQEQGDIWVKEFTQREDERRWEQEKLRMCQENKLLHAQVQPHDSRDMAVPELEEIRRMFVPVEQGPKETFEYFVLEPRPGEEQIRREAEQKMQCLMGLRDTHGIHLNLSDRAKKRTTIQLAMGPKLSNGERKQSCKILSTPGALCSACGDDSTTPSVLIPQCLKPLMQTLTYRVNEIETPLLSMKAFGCENDGGRSNGKEVALESGPNFNGSRLYGTIVLPKGKTLSSFYTQPYNVSF